MTAAFCRRDFLKTTGSSLIFSALSRGGLADSGFGMRPNILFINVDQLSIRAISGYGCPDVKTPHIDRLMQKGYAFRKSYITNPTCGPSRACWQTGRMASEHGVLSNSLSHKMLPDIPDMGQWLRKAGYRTFHTGKWHVIGRPVQESYCVLAAGTRNTGENGDVSVVHSVEGFLGNYSGSAPFLTVCGLMNPHDICWWIAQHSELTEMPAILRDRLPPLPFNFGVAERECEDMQAMRKYNMEVRNVRVWSDDVWRLYRWAYYRYVEMVDACVGRILDALDNSPFRENTLVIFSSDHGDTSGAHKGHLMKGTLYEESVSVPLIYSFPGRVPEEILDEETLAAGYDLLPTVCDYAGVEPPVHQRGISLRPVMEQGVKPAREAVFSEARINGRMVRTSRYKYLRYYKGENEMLFDLEKDPGELVNLAYHPEYAPVLAHHQKLHQNFEHTLISAGTPATGMEEGQ